MMQLNKGKAKYFSHVVMALFIVVSIFYANFSYSITINDKKTAITSKKNSRQVVINLENKKVKKSLIIETGFLDTTIVPKIDTINFSRSKDSLNAPVYYQAEDSMVFDIPAKRLYLYGKEASIKYEDNELMAPFISFDQASQTVGAYLIKDSTGKVITYPTFNQSDFKTISDTIQFNMKTGKGLTKGTYTQQGEMFVYGEKIKKINEREFFAKNGRFTTCNLDTPHFAFVSNKIKFINKKMAFTGPVHPEIEGVPIPVVLPFGLYPLTQGRHSGFISPNFTANDQLGLAMEGVGYYKILSDNWDVVARGTLYSYGGWTFGVSPRYFKKYRYQGNFSVNLMSLKNGFKGDPDFSKNNTFKINWSHTADMKARPGVTFNAFVNAGSSKFNSQVPNSPATNFNNTLNSSISYSKVWKDKPFNFQVSANHDQNTNLNLINFRFPDANFSVNTLYPFRKKEGVGEAKWYENIGIALNTVFKSTSFFYDTASAAAKQLSNNFRWGASHDIPISLSLPALGPLQISPRVSYQEKWYQEKFALTWNPTDKKIDTSIQRGFYTAREMSYGVGVTSRIFGMIGFNKNSKVQAIRHEIRPSIGLNYKPDMNARNFYTIQTDTTGRTAQFNYFERSILGSFSSGRFGGMNFGIDNVLQMKYKNGKDTAQEAQKISLLDGLSINGAYNFLKDSFQLEFLQVAARTNLLNKLSITASAIFDPYITNSSGIRTKKLTWTKTPISLGRLVSGQVSLDSRFNGGDKQTTNNKQQTTNTNSQTGMPMDEYQQEAAYIQKNASEFADFSIPWSVSFSYSLRFFRNVSPTNPSKFTTTINQDFNWNGDINLSPKWKIGMSGSYNISLKELGVLSMNLSRDLHCWQMQVSVSPVGRYKFLTINISPKSSLLRDIKVNRTRYFYDL
jgi:hypothetical protein